jgi:hypothetical protein
MDGATLYAKLIALAPVLTERSTWLRAATEARVPGRGGLAFVERTTGVSRLTNHRKLWELEAGEVLVRIERVGLAGGAARHLKTTLRCRAIWTCWWNRRR